METPFNALAHDGSSTLVVVADELTRTSTVMLDGVGLSTQPDGEGRLSATVPASFLIEPGQHAITVRTTLGESNPIPLVVAPKTTNPPTLTSLSPASTVQDRAFSPGPDGRSMLQIDALDLARGTVVVYDGITLPTEARGETTLLAAVPAEFLGSPGSHAITLRNAQGESNALEFVVASKPTFAPVLTAVQPRRIRGRRGV